MLRNRLIAAGAGLAALALVAARAIAGNGSGGGAQKSQLTNEGSNMSNCPAAASRGSQSAPPNGFVILNSTGMPGSTSTIQGEVSLKNAPAGNYSVFLQSDMSGSSCMVLDGMLTTNAEGNGNFHITSMETAPSQHYWVVLKQMTGGNRQYASAAVLLD